MICICGHSKEYHHAGGGWKGTFGIGCWVFKNGIPIQDRYFAIRNMVCPCTEFKLNNLSYLEQKYNESSLR